MENLGKKRILGLDAGTNSLGWAVVERGDDGYQLIDKGVQIFQEGVNIEKGTIEKSRAAERTEHRSLRKTYWRRKVRKIRVLAVLSNAGLCPPLSSEELHKWRVEGKYPLENESFIQWQRTDENKNINPYASRVMCIEQSLDMNKAAERYIIGRALYHIAQRRGFLSNRKDQTDEKSLGAVKKGIAELTKKIKDSGCEYLCQYLYLLYKKGERIRGCYTDRKEHYEKEFEAICSKQQLDDTLKKELHKVIFEQRPLKSQRRGVAKCPFESAKQCAPISHPLFESFRMWSFIRNIKVMGPHDFELRPLSGIEIDKILPLWQRKSKNNFDFEDIAKAIAGKGQYCYYKSAEEKPYRFNYHLDSNVSGCPVSTRLHEIFSDDILSDRAQIDMIWHALDNFDDDLKLREWVIRHYNVSEEQADAFVKIRLPRGFASLSLKAIENILPPMRDHGMQYTEATLIAKLRDLLKGYNFDDEIEAYLKDDIRDYLTIPKDKNGKPTISRDERKQSLLTKWHEHYHLEPKDLKKMYHPSMIEEYPKVESKLNGVFQLGSPRISALKNPMAMRSLFRLRAVVNQLLKEGTIDENTIVHIEFARELNDANHRDALRRYQNDLKKEREEAKKQINSYVTNPNDDDILKYLLWEDQGHKCIYTNKTISLEALYNGTDFDVEHTIPRSMGGDTTRENLTICDSTFNRETKKTNLPIDLSNYEIIKQNIAQWKEKYENLDKQIRKINTSGVSDKGTKDSMISKRHYLELKRDFWKNKYKAFTIEEKDVQGFTRRQGTDISVINRYGRLFLLSLFNRVDVVKGSMTAAFRKLWGLQSAYEQKNRENHVHHCIDAITIACMGKTEYDNLSAYYREDEENRYHNSGKIFPKPWATFTEDVRHIEDELLVAHHTNNPMGKQTRKRIRTAKGKIIPNQFAQGDTARGALHKDTQYGAIKFEGQIKYVVRKPLDANFTDVKNIVDDEVKAKVEAAIAEYGSLGKALESGPIWMNKEKGIAIKKVRIFTPSVTRPNHIRQQRDLSKYEYKRQYHVMSDSNYALAIYEGVVGNNTKREIKLLSNLDAAIIYNNNNNHPLIPEYDEHNYHLLLTLYSGSLVLLYEKSPEELYSAHNDILKRRLYKVTGLNSTLIGNVNYGRIELTYHQEARPSTEVKSKNGAFETNEELRPKITMLHTQIKALVEGQDFIMSETGKIEFRHA